MPEYALEYACSAIVAMRRLQTLREESALQADYVLVYGASLLNTRWRNWSSVLASVNILHDQAKKQKKDNYLTSFTIKLSRRSKQVLNQWVELGGTLRPMDKELSHYHRVDDYHRGSLHKFLAFLLYDGTLEHTWVCKTPAGKAIKPYVLCWQAVIAYLPSTY